MKSSEATRKGRSRPKGCLLKKQIAGALVGSLLIGAAPGWTQEIATAKSSVEENAGRQFRDSIDRAMDRSIESEQAAAGVVPFKEPSVAGPQLTAHERRDLDTRHAALRTDPVARGTGGIILALVSIGITVGVTAWAIHHYSKDNPTTTAMMARR
jgi:type II secretory pathway pseudopilin PulG